MATHLIIPSSFRLQIKEDTLWNDVGALYKCGAITVGNNVIGCGLHGGHRIRHISNCLEREPARHEQ